MAVAYSYEEDVKADPRLAGLEPGQSRTFMPSPEEMPKPGESRYLIAHYDLPSVFPAWANEPDSRTWGMGRGLPGTDEVPRFRLDACKAEITQPDIWPWMNTVFLVTKRMLDLINEFDPEAVEARPADFLFSDGLPPDEPYYVADFVKRIEAVNKSQSVTSYKRLSLKYEAMQIESAPGRALLQVELPVALKPDIPDSIHIFRCEALGIFFSRKIIDEMVKRRFRRMRFDDPAVGPGSPYGAPSIYVNGNGTGKPQ